jgi:hypothetical protein
MPRSTAGLLTAVAASVSVLAALAHGIVFVIVAVAVGAASFLGFYLALPSGAPLVSKKTALISENLPK